MHQLSLHRNEQIQFNSIILAGQNVETIVVKTRTGETGSFNRDPNGVRASDLKQLNEHHSQGQK